MTSRAQMLSKNNKVSTLLVHHHVTITLQTDLLLPECQALASTNIRVKGHCSTRQAWVTPLHTPGVRGFCFLYYYFFNLRVPSLVISCFLFTELQEQELGVREDALYFRMSRQSDCQCLPKPPQASLLLRCHVSVVALEQTVTKPSQSPMRRVK